MPFVGFFCGRIVIDFLFLETGFCDWQKERALETILFTVLANGRIGVREDVASEVSGMRF